MAAKEIKDQRAIESIIRRASVCRLAMCDGGVPYIVPLGFGYEDMKMFFHSGNMGKKLDILRKNNRVCFEIDIDVEPLRHEEPCNWGMKYKSVVGFGRAYFVHSPEEKKRALDTIMRQYTDGSFTYPEEKVASALVIKVEIDSMTGKIHE